MSYKFCGFSRGYEATRAYHNGEQLYYQRKNEMVPVHCELTAIRYFESLFIKEECTREEFVQKMENAFIAQYTAGDIDMDEFGNYLFDLGFTYKGV